MKKLNKSIVERIKQLMISDSDDLPSWNQFFHDEYKAANSQIRIEIIDEFLANNP